MSSLWDAVFIQVLDRTGPLMLNLSGTPYIVPAKPNHLQWFISDYAEGSREVNCESENWTKSCRIGRKPLSPDGRFQPSTAKALSRSLNENAFGRQNRRTNHLSVRSWSSSPQFLCGTIGSMFFSGLITIIPNDHNTIGSALSTPRRRLHAVPTHCYAPLPVM
jgi:hypothetical protein